MISLQGIHKTFPATKRAGEVEALIDVNLAVERGQVLGIVGPSGSGKSTLARCINLLERPDSGTVRVGGQELTSLRGEALTAARRNIGMIFQQFNLLDSRSAVANVELPLELAGVGRQARRARAEELLQRVGLGEKLHQHPAQLSGGQRQRVAIARALASEPEVLLCDEATSALDDVSTDNVLRLIRELTDELGLTTVLITHEMGVVKRICDGVVLLEEGRVVDTGRLCDVASSPESPLARRLLPPVHQLVGDDVEVIVTDDRDTLTELVRDYGVGVRVVAGSVEDLAGVKVGRLVVRLSGPSGAISRARNHVRQDTAYAAEPATALAGGGAP